MFSSCSASLRALRALGLHLGIPRGAGHLLKGRHSEQSSTGDRKTPRLLSQAVYISISIRINAYASGFLRLLVVRIGNCVLRLMAVAGRQRQSARWRVCLSMIWSQDSSASIVCEVQV